MIYCIQSHLVQMTDQRVDRCLDSFPPALKAILQFQEKVNVDSYCGLWVDPWSRTISILGPNNRDEAQELVGCVKSHASLLEDCWMRDMPWKEYNITNAVVEIRESILGGRGVFVRNGQTLPPNTWVSWYPGSPKEHKNYDSSRNYGLQVFVYFVVENFTLVLQIGNIVWDASTQGTTTAYGHYVNSSHPMLPKPYDVPNCEYVSVEVVTPQNKSGKVVTKQIRGGVISGSTAVTGGSELLCDYHWFLKGCEVPPLEGGSTSIVLDHTCDMCDEVDATQPGGAHERIKKKRKTSSQGVGGEQLVDGGLNNEGEAAVEEDDQEEKKEEEEAESGNEQQVDGSNNDAPVDVDGEGKGDESNNEGGEEEKDAKGESGDEHNGANDNEEEEEAAEDDQEEYKDGESNEGGEDDVEEEEEVVEEVEKKDVDEDREEGVENTNDDEEQTSSSEREQDDDDEGDEKSNCHDKHMCGTSVVNTMVPNEGDTKYYVAPSGIPGAGAGIFAKVAIKKGTSIGRFGGIQVCENCAPKFKNPDDWDVIEGDTFDETMYFLRRSGKLEVDGDMWYVNSSMDTNPEHLRKPNAVFVGAGFQCSDYVTRSPEVVIDLVAVAAISPNSELLVSYMMNPKDSRTIKKK